MPRKSTSRSTSRSQAAAKKTSKKTSMKTSTRKRATGSAKGKTKSASSKSSRRTTRVRAGKAELVTTTRTTKTAIPKPVTDVVTEETVVKTQPVIEIYRPATLSQALTEPATAVVKSKSDVVRRSVKHRRSA